MTRHSSETHVMLVVFDLDGTLVDSRADICAAVGETLSHLGCPAVEDEALFPLIGLPLRDIFQAVLPDESAHQIDPACEFYRSYYFDHCAVHTKPFAGVLECLEALSGVKRAICTGKMRFQAVRVLQQLDMIHLFDRVVGSDDLPCKPDPAALNGILRDLNVPPQHAWMVGDTTFDILAGKAAGMRTCALTCGTHDRAALESAAPDLVLNELTHFPQIIGMEHQSWSEKPC